MSPEVEELLCEISELLLKKNSNSQDIKKFKMLISQMKTSAVIYMDIDFVNKALILRNNKDYFFIRHCQSLFFSKCVQDLDKNIHIH